MACRPRARRSSKPSPLCQFRGKYNSDSENANVPEKSGGATPTIVQVRPFTITFRPTTDGSPPNLRCQVEYTEDGDRIDSPRRSFVDTYHAAKSRAYVKQLKVVARHPSDEDALGLASDWGKAKESDTVTSNVLKEVYRRTAIVLDVFERNAAEGLAGGSLACDHDEPVAIPHRQGSEHDSVHDAEHSGVHSDTKCERERRRERETRRSVQHPQAVTNVLQKRLEERSPSGF